MIEGGGLGAVAATEVEGVRVAKQYLSYTQGRLADWDCADQKTLRHTVPENRLRVYDIRLLIRTLADTGSVLELRRSFGPGIITALIRIEGRPLGLIANDPAHLGGAVDANGGDKIARFMPASTRFWLTRVLRTLSFGGRCRQMIDPW